ncbi:MAG: hypothetical protein ACYS6K_16060 [Planctomycetota bacterium]|jgi:hypothetical protein
MAKTPPKADHSRFGAPITITNSPRQMKRIQQNLAQLTKGTKMAKTKGKTIRTDVISIITKTKKPMTIRQLLDAVNKTRKPKDKVTIFGVRRIVHILIENKTLTATKKGKAIVVSAKKGKVKK